MSLDFRGLNPQQRQAVEHGDGPLLLLAGAGTGKTRVITYRIARLIARGVPAEHILAVTFTNKAAREMRERLTALLSPAQVKDLTASTFHSFCAKILRARIPRLGYGRNFDIASDSYQLGLVRNVMSELGLTQNGLTGRDYLQMISMAKSRLLTPDQVTSSNGSWSPGLPDVYALYQRRLKNMDLVDFDDLLMLVVQLWQTHPKELDAHRQRYQHLLVDEYQDTNAVQFELMASLAGSIANICAVGDDDQSIYGWRGADVTNILHFEEHFPNAAVIRLEQNYRSTETILNAANQVIAHNRERHPKKLWSKNGTGEPILVVSTEDETAEATFAVDFIRDRCATRGGGLNQFAILYRSNHQSRSLEDAFLQADLPYRLVGAKSFYQRKEILDAVSFLKAAQNPKDDLSLLRILNVPPRGLGDKAVERLHHLQTITALPLQELLASRSYTDELPAVGVAGARTLSQALTKYREIFSQPGSLARNVAAYLREIDYLDGLGRMYKPRADAQKRLENVNEFFNAVADYERRRSPGVSLLDFLEDFTLMDDNDKVDDDHSGPDEAVTLMTVHAAKGLEFPVVLVVGMENHLFPHEQSLKEGSGEEERRLFYVAMTRAKEELALVYATKRRVRGDPVRRRHSPFLDELPDELTVWTDARAALIPATQEHASGFLAGMMAKFAPEED